MNDDKLNSEKVNSDKPSNKSSDEILREKKKKLFRYIYYIVLLILTLILKNFLNLNSFTLGDFGSITPLLLFLVSFTGFKWLPIFSLAGLLVTKFEDKLGDFGTGFIIVVSIIALTTFGLGLFLGV